MPRIVFYSGVKIQCNNLLDLIFGLLTHYDTNLTYLVFTFSDYLVVLQNILDYPEKYLNLSGGILNFHSHYKLAEIFETNAKSNIAPSTNLQDFPNLLYMQWLTYFLNGKYEDSKSMLVNNEALICDLLIQDLRGYAKEYQKSKLTVRLENKFREKIFLF